MGGPSPRAQRVPRSHRHHTGGRPLRDTSLGRGVQCRHAAEYPKSLCHVERQRLCCGRASSCPRAPGSAGRSGRHCCAAGRWWPRRSPLRGPGPPGCRPSSRGTVGGCTSASPARDTRGPRSLSGPVQPPAGTVPGVVGRCPEVLQPRAGQGHTPNRTGCWEGPRWWSPCVRTQWRLSATPRARRSDCRRTEASVGPQCAPVRAPQSLKPRGLAEPPRSGTCKPGRGCHHRAGGPSMAPPPEPPTLLWGGACPLGALACPQQGSSSR